MENEDDLAGNRRRPAPEQETIEMPDADGVANHSGFWHDITFCRIGYKSVSESFWVRS